MTDYEIILSKKEAAGNCKNTAPCRLKATVVLQCLFLETDCSCWTSHLPMNVQNVKTCSEGFMGVLEYAKWRAPHILLHLSHSRPF